MENIIIDKNHVYYSGNGVKAIPYSAEFTECICEEIRGSMVQLWIAPELSRQITVSGANTEEQVFAKLSDDILIRRPHIYDILFQSNNIAVIVWFDFNRLSLEQWAVRNSFNIKGIDTVLNGFSFLCPPRGSVVFDFGSSLGIMKRNNTCYSDIFTVSTSDNTREDDISEAVKFCGTNNCKVFSEFPFQYPAGFQSFFFEKHEYPVKTWREFLLGSAL